MKTHISLRYDAAEYGWQTRCGRLIQDLDRLTGGRGPFVPGQDLCRSCKRSANDALVFTIESTTEALDELQAYDDARTALIGEGQ